MALVAVVGLGGCYEHMPRSGPLAGIADSLFPPTRPVHCVRGDARLPGWKKYHVCAVVSVAGDARTVDLGGYPQSDAFYVGTGGRVLGITQTWPADAIGDSLAAAMTQQLSATFGAPAYDGDDVHGNRVIRWVTDAICIGLHQNRQEPTFYHLGRFTRDFFSSCPS